MAGRSLRNFLRHSTDDSVQRGVFIWTFMVLGLLARYFLTPFESRDYQVFLHPWISFIRLRGGFHALGESFSDYNPPYLYLLVLSSFLPRSIPDVVVIKMSAIIFDVVLAYLTMRIVQLRSSSTLSASIVFVTVLFLPTVLLNASMWGQCDSIYTSFLLLSLLWLLQARPYASLVAFGVALSFKLQAVFFVPLLLCAWIKGLLCIRHFFVAALVYVTMMLPVLVAGRGLAATFKIYLEQAGLYDALSMNAPTLYAWVPNNFYEILAPVGFVLTTAAILSLALLVFRSRAPLSTPVLVSLALLSVMVIPFFLPKMHDRYFFPADVFSIIFAFYNPTLWIVPVAIQLASLSVYVGYLFGKALFPTTVGSMLMLGALLLTVRRLYSLLYSRNAHESSDAVENGVRTKQGIFAPSFGSVTHIGGFIVLILFFLLGASYRINWKPLSAVPSIRVVRSLGAEGSDSLADVGNNFVLSVSFEQEWGGQPLVDRNMDENKLRNGGRIWQNGFGVHANSVVRFQLKEKYVTFKASVGIPDYVKSGASVRFSVWGDNRMLWQSSIIRAGLPIQSLSVPVRGVRMLELRVDDGGDGNYSDHASWLEPELLPVLPVPVG